MLAAILTTIVWITSVITPVPEVYQYKCLDQDLEATPILPNSATCMTSSDPSAAPGEEENARDGVGMQGNFSRLGSEGCSFDQLDLRLAESILSEIEIVEQQF